jgi:hypothetical protein
MAEGIILKHDSLSNQLWVVENPARPFSDGGYDCNLCVGVHHVGKTTHLWLEPNGCCIVSPGVLDELRRAGMPSLTVVGHVAAPPPLRIGRKSDRQRIDNENRKMWLPQMIGV